MNHLLTKLILMSHMPGDGTIRLRELPADAPAPGANQATIYAKDNGASKTQTVVRFATGAVQTTNTEP